MCLILVSVLLIHGHGHNNKPLIPKSQYITYHSICINDLLLHLVVDFTVHLLSLHSAVW